MLKLNAIQIMNNRGYSKYKLFNSLNNIRAKKGEPLMNYTNFQHMINQENKSVLYQDLDELCEALNCEIGKLLTREEGE